MGREPDDVVDHASREFEASHDVVGDLGGASSVAVEVDSVVTELEGIGFSDVVKNGCPVHLERWYWMRFAFAE